MKSPCQYQFRTARTNAVDVRSRMASLFRQEIGNRNIMDARPLDAGATRALVWASTGTFRPLFRVAGGIPEVSVFLQDLGRQPGDFLLLDESNTLRLFGSEGGIHEISLSESMARTLLAVRRASDHWVGELTEEGDHVFDPRTPSPGTHFRANLLIGDRAGFPNPLLTTPKAVVDEWGRGSSRTHADKQILATRWDVVPEENGFPANRQFYLVEDGRQIFFSAAADADTEVQTRHAANHTVICYRLPHGLEIERTIFVVPAEEGLPLGVEAQIVRISNRGARHRDLSLVMTGMFGFIHPGALTVDVIYTCVTVEPGVVEDTACRGAPVIAPRYTAGWGIDDRPFNITQVFDASDRGKAPSAFCLDYRCFIGNGSMEKPQNVANPDNRPPVKGPAFFALTFPLALGPGQECECHSVNGVMSRHEGEAVTDEVFCRKIASLADKAADREWLRRALGSVRASQDAYRSAVQIATPDANVNRLVNVHLPFQIRYQTYVSRAFGLTQKGFRQIGFREIQDLFAALPFEVAAGRQAHVRDMIGVWASHVHRFGYADHQFYWTGMEPGRYSDDALWLFQAVGRYVDLTGDVSILAADLPVAGEENRRSLYDTLLAILRYSGCISVGRHGLPLIDRADWNDTLNLDGEGLPGPEKEALYRKQIAAGQIREGQGLVSDLSESVMNGFLLEMARSRMVRFAELRTDSAVAREWSDFGDGLRTRLRQSWRGDFYARALINRRNEHGITYLGAAGDGVSADSSIPGTYFLNSFSWSILSGVADDAQIETMLDRVEQILVTPVGIRLSSPARFDRLMGRSGSGDYAYGDRENGGVFKHAAMMAVTALFEGARRVGEAGLAERLHSLGLRVLRVTAPYAAFEDPYVLAGNPRFCTQYVNPATGEHVGPLLSGTAPWMWLSYMNMLGVTFREGRLVLDPVLPPAWSDATLSVRMPAGQYRIHIAKPAGFVRSADRKPRITIDGVPTAGVLPACEAGRCAEVSIDFGEGLPPRQ